MEQYGLPNEARDNIIKFQNVGTPLTVDGVYYSNPQEREYLDAGWVLNEPPVFDPATHKLVPDSYTITDTTCTQNIIALTPEEIEANEQSEIEIKLADVRAACNQHITVTLGWTKEQQLNTTGINSPEEKYRINCLDAVSKSVVECNRCEDVIADGDECIPTWPDSSSAEPVYSYEETKLQ